MNSGSISADLPSVVDTFGRPLGSLRLSVTDRCNLRCSYCMPAEGVKPLPHDEILRNEEFIYFIHTLFFYLIEIQLIASIHFMHFLFKKILMMHFLDS